MPAAAPPARRAAARSLGPAALPRAAPGRPCAPPRDASALPPRCGSSRVEGARPRAAAALPAAALALGGAASARRPAAARRGRRRVATAAAARARGGVEAGGPARAALLRGLAAALPAGLLPEGALGRAGQAAAASASLAGCSAVVTGASRGIGKGIAVALGECGASVFITGRSQGALAETATLVAQAGGSCTAFQCDHADDKRVREVFSQIGEQTGGSLNILVNNAFKFGTADPELERALSQGAKFYDIPLSVWDEINDVGLRSHYAASVFAAPMLLKAARSGGVRPLLCFTSSFGGVSYLFTPAYGIGKAAVDRMARDFQVELGPQGVDCLSVWPGVVLTEKVADLAVTDKQRVEKMTGGQDLDKCAESPLLTGRVIGRLAADDQLRRPPYVTPDGLTGRICIVAEAARDLRLRDGGPAGSVAAGLYGPDREPAPSIRSLGYLGPGFIRGSLPEGARFLAEAGGPLANPDVKMPLEFMSQGPPQTSS